MRFLNELHEGDRINGIYLCKQKQSAVTKNGKPYENIILQDKTGIMDGKIWDPNSLGIDDFDALDYIDVVGDVTSFAGAMQLNIKRVRKAAEDEYNPADYLPVSENSTDDMYSQLRAFIDSVENTYLSALLKKLFVEDEAFVKAFEGHSAAKTVHHGFIGGLMEHTLGVTRLCDYMSKAYPVINRDLLITASLLHDIGKPFTKSFVNSKGETTEIAHYYEHQHVSAYDSLFYSNPSLNRLYIANIIQWHMRPFELERDPHSGKAQKRFKKLVGNKLYSDVMKLHAADIEAKGT